jgi:hypothetical protein
MAKKIELSTRPGWGSSTRWLTSTHLVVDWCGNGNLFYRMTKNAVRNVLGGADVAHAKAQPLDEKPKFQDFQVKRTKATFRIGCEKFNAADLKAMRKWCGGQ